MYTEAAEVRDPADVIPWRPGRGSACSPCRTERQFGGVWGGPPRIFFQMWPLIRAFSDFRGGGARPFWDARRGRAPPRPPPPYFAPLSGDARFPLRCTHGGVLNLTQGGAKEAQGGAAGPRCPP